MIEAGRTLARGLASSYGELCLVVGSAAPVPHWSPAPSCSPPSSSRLDAVGGGGSDPHADGLRRAAARPGRAGRAADHRHPAAGRHPDHHRARRRGPGGVWTVEVNIPGGDDLTRPRRAADRPLGPGERRRTRRPAAGGRLRPAGRGGVTPTTADYAGGHPRLAGAGRQLGLQGRRGRAARPPRRGRRSPARPATPVGTGARPPAGPGGSAPHRRPAPFSGSLVASYGPDLERRETISALAAAAGATAAQRRLLRPRPRSGAPGDPAGVGVYDGRLLSETVGRRPASSCGRPPGRTRSSDCAGRVGAAGHGPPAGPQRHQPGTGPDPQLRRHGGRPADLAAPARRDVHRQRRTGRVHAGVRPETPSGRGTEVVLDSRCRVVALRAVRGGALAAGRRSVQATGDLADGAGPVAVVGARLQVTTAVHGQGRCSDPPRGLHRQRGPRTGPGRPASRHPAADGFVQPVDPSFYYGCGHQRNPRTFAGTDAAGRTLIATVDGRSTTSLGASIVETARWPVPWGCATR